MLVSPAHIGTHQVYSVIAAYLPKITKIDFPSKPTIRVLGRAGPCLLDSPTVRPLGLKEPPLGIALRWTKNHGYFLIGAS
jgi:hypothetical protein